ncbi:MAG TPA: hypothetical protein VNZ49_03775 [Bacteroidia bacterium]|jgi:hypothetical protein|nr:hypothetical protein [Bacteroidia bacterium]
MPTFFKKYALFAALFFPTLFYGQFYYGLQQEFGKSRVQYQPFYWTYYGFDRYQVYLYEGCEDIAKYVSYRTEYHLKDLEKKLDHQIDDKLQILVYSNQGDFRQTNLGLSTDETTNTGGTTKIVGTKMSVFFDGSHANLDKQIRAGIAEILINDLLYGGRTRDVIRNSALLVVPDWFKNGLISYLSEPWNTDLDNVINDGIANDRYFNFNKLDAKESAVAGHALWHYIADTYGESSIANILYMTKVSRKVENAFLFILGTNSQGLVFEWIDSRMRNTANNDTTRTLPNSDPLVLRPKTSKDYYQLKISPDGQKVVYVTNQMTQYRVYLQDLTTGKKKRIAKKNPKIERLNDLTYPLLAWHPGGQAFAMIHEKKGIIYLTTYNVENHDKFSKPITGIEKVIDFSYSPDGKKIVFSAVKKSKGQSDIFVYQINAGGLEQITNDSWDDNNPRFIGKGNMIVFSSNRQHDTLKESENSRYDLDESKYNDIFLYDYKTKSKHLYRVTDTKRINETNPGDFYEGHFTYLSDQNGIKNRFVAKLDSVISFVDTSEHYRYVFNAHAVSNYKYNVLENDINLKAGKMAEVFFHDGNQYMYISSIDKSMTEKITLLKNTFYRRSTLYGQSRASNGSNPSNTPPPPLKNETPVKKDSTAKVDIDNYNFKGTNPPPTNTGTTSSTVSTATNTIITGMATQNSNGDFKFPIKQNYYVNFAVDQVIAQLDNSFLATSYQPFSYYYVNPGFSVLTKMAASDLFEDYRIVGGFRFNLNITGINAEYFISIENRKKLWDKQLVLHRLALPHSLNTNMYSDVSYAYLVKSLTHDVQYKLKYPINEVSSVKGTLYYRNDRYVFKAQDDFTLPLKNQYDNWAGIKGEYVFDNTRARGLNLYNGWRLKIFGEYYRQINVDSLTKRHDLVVFGADIRHYLKIHRSLIWANRLAGSTSFGTDKLCYYLGGTDNWVGAKFNTQQEIKHAQTYAFQAIATNMRGFQQNARNGNNFVVLNSELRWPIFQYFANHPISSDFFNNFQVVGFGDVGMCWYGANPFSDENTLNKYSFYKNPVTVIIYEKKQPIIAGYGFGLRSRIFGYFVRVDFAWGVDNYTQQNRMTTFSLGTDF